MCHFGDNNAISAPLPQEHIYFIGTALLSQRLSPSHHPHVKSDLRYCRHFITTKVLFSTPQVRSNLPRCYRKGVTLTPLIRNNMFYQRCLIAMKVSYQHHILRATRLIDVASLPKWYHLEITSSLQCEMSSRHVTKRTF